MHFAKSAYNRKQAHADAVIKQQQAWAATGSSVVALIDLAIGIASFVRAGKTAKKNESLPVATLTTNRPLMGLTRTRFRPCGSSGEVSTDLRLRRP